MAPLINAEYNKTTNIYKKKKSDTQFVLGSGPSINKINFWDKIRENDSIGFNFFLIHNFIPKFYLIEPTYIEIYKRLFLNQLKLIKLKKKYLSETNLFINRMASYKILEKFLKKNKIDFKLVTSFDMQSENETILKENLSSKALNLASKFFLSGQGCASLERIVLSSYFAGYKKIILCGIDLNNADYFYFQNENYDNNLKKITLSLINHQKKHHQNNLHFTNDKEKCKSGIPVEILLYYYQTYLFKDKAQIYIANPNSVLKKYFPVYKL